MSIADEAESLLRRRAHLVRRIERVNATIQQWREVESNDALPVDMKRGLRHPELSLEDCEALHRMLVEELERLERANEGSA